MMGTKIRMLRRLNHDTVAHICFTLVKRPDRGDAVDARRVQIIRYGKEFFLIMTFSAGIAGAAFAQASSGGAMSSGSMSNGSMSNGAMSSESAMASDKDHMASNDKMKKKPKKDAMANGSMSNGSMSSGSMSSSSEH